jgi:hypothetical protein
LGIKVMFNYANLYFLHSIDSVARGSEFSESKSAQISAKSAQNGPKRAKLAQISANQRKISAKLAQKQAKLDLNKQT